MARALRRRVRNLLLLSVITLVLLEVVLQLGAIGVWFFGRRTPTSSTTASGPTVLCVGDSFTYGVGTTDLERFSYPSRLQATLRQQTGEAWTVVNRGWPGQNSAEVLQRLDAQIAEHRPAVVCILVGINDGWSKPPRVPASMRVEAADPGAFRFEWRTARLFALFVGMLRSPSSPRAPVGVWSVNGVPVEFTADGKLLVGSAVMRWTAPESDQIALRVGEGGEMLLHWRLDGASLVVSGPGLVTPITLTPRDPDAPVAVDPMVEGWSAFTAGKPAEAIERFERAAAAQPDNPAPREQLARLYKWIGANDKVEEVLSWLRARHEKTGDVLVAEVLATAVSQTAEVVTIVETAQALSRKHPRSSKILEILGRFLNQDGKVTEARAAIDAAVELAHQSGPASWEAMVHATRAGIYCKDDPPETLASVIRATMLVSEQSHAERLMRTYVSPRWPRELLAQCIDRLHLGAEERIRVERAYERAMGSRSESYEVLAYHLVQAVERCRHAGAEPFLVSYPTRIAELDEAIVRAQRESAAPLVQAFEGIEKAMAAGTPRVDLFVPDGHCTDRGYGLLAEEVARAILRSRRPR